MNMSAVQSELVQRESFASQPCSPPCGIAVSASVSSTGDATRRTGQTYAAPFSALHPETSAWVNSGFKRLIDLSVALILLILLAPLFCVLGVLVGLGSRGPIIFKQKRVGKGQTQFTIYKFRTMTVVPEAAINRRSRVRDLRVTPGGTLLRKYKLDELPQLVNVLRGEMSLVGPRPKLPEHHLGNLVCRPGLTGRASLAFAAEAHLVEDIPEHLLDQFHTSFISPLKLQLDQEYMKMASFCTDLKLIWHTVLRKGCYLDLSKIVHMGEAESSVATPWQVT